MDSQHTTHLIYCRASADAAESLESQEKRLRTFARQQGIDIGGVFTDIVSSRAERPGFQAMLNRIHQGDIDGILATDPSRLGRSPRDSAKIFSCLIVGFLQSVYTLQDPTYFSLDALYDRLEEIVRGRRPCRRRK